MDIASILKIVLGSLTPQMLLVLFAGTLIGFFVGAMPGIGVPVGLALIIPFTYVMKPDLALVLMASIFMSAEYANAIPAITINTPGTTGAVATCFDGYPMGQKGQVMRAISLSLNASVVGGLMGILSLIFLSIPIVRLALQFGPAEYFAIGTFGIVLVISMKGSESIKGLISALFGFWLSMIGLDMLTGQIRFIFGMKELIDGISLPSVFIGLLAFPELIKGIENWKQQTVAASDSSVPGNTEPSEPDEFLSLWKTLRYKWTMLRAGIIGIIIGAIPGTGASIANLLAYETEKKASKYPEKFGTGVDEGVVAAETANNAVVGASLIPLLTLGIPGSNAGAVMLMVLMMHQVIPGPQLFIRNPTIVYVLYTGLILSVLAMWLAGKAILRHIGSFKKIPYSYILPTVTILCFVGAFSIHFSLFDVYAAFGFGVLGYFMKRWGFATAPAVIGLVLGKMIEINFRRTILSGYGTYQLFYTRPIAVVFLSVMFVTLVWSLFKEFSGKKKEGSA